MEELEKLFDSHANAGQSSELAHYQDALIEARTKLLALSSNVSSLMASLEVDHPGLLAEYPATIAKIRDILHG